MLQLTSRRFLRELDEAPGGNNLQYILKCPCIPFFGNQGLHNEIMLGGNGGCSGVMYEGSPYKNPLDCSFVFLFYLRKDQNVVQVHYYDLFGYEGPEDVVHHSLEDSGTVGHSKEYHKRFEEAAVGVESSFPFISRLDVYIIKAPVDIQFGEVSGSVELGDEFRDK